MTITSNFELELRSPNFRCSADPGRVAPDRNANCGKERVDGRNPFSTALRTVQQGRRTPVNFFAEIVRKMRTVIVSEIRAEKLWKSLRTHV
jgi:hypothetical protein